MIKILRLIGVPIIIFLWILSVLIQICFAILSLLDMQKEILEYGIMNLWYEIKDWIRFGVRSL